MWPQSASINMISLFLFFKSCNFSLPGTPRTHALRLKSYTRLKSRRKNAGTDAANERTAVEQWRRFQIIVRVRARIDSNARTEAPHGFDPVVVTETTAAPKPITSLLGRFEDYRILQ